MQGFGWITFLFIGLIAGWIAEKVMKRNQGLLTNLVVGVIGAYIGAFLFSIFGLHATSFIGAVIVATAGAIVLLAIVGWIRGRRSG